MKKLQGGGSLSVAVGTVNCTMLLAVCLCALYCGWLPCRCHRLNHIDKVHLVSAQDSLENNDLTVFPREQAGTSHFLSCSSLMYSEREINNKIKREGDYYFLFQSA